MKPWLFDSLLRLLRQVKKHTISVNCECDRLLSFQFPVRFFFRVVVSSYLLESLLLATDSWTEPLCIVVSLMFRCSNFSVFRFLRFRVSLDQNLVIFTRIWLLSWNLALAQLPEAAELSLCCVLACEYLFCIPLLHFYACDPSFSCDFFYFSDLMSELALKFDTFYGYCTLSMALHRFWS